MSDAETEEVSLDSNCNEEELSSVVNDAHDFEKRLIEEVKQRPFLFDHTSAGFKDIKNKDAGWLQVAQIVGKSVTKCQCRWKSLRDRYVRESRKIREGNGPKRHLWEMFKYLAFLDDIPRMRGCGGATYLEPNVWKRGKVPTKRLPVFVMPSLSPQPQATMQLTISNVTSTNSTAQMVSAPSSVSVLSASPSPVVQLDEAPTEQPISRKPSSMPVTNNNHSTTANNMNGNNSMLTTLVDMADGCCAFGMSVSATLRTLPIEQQELAKLRIQQVLYEIQFS